MYNPYGNYSGNSPMAYNAPIPTSNLIYVNGLEDARTRYVAPGNTMLFIDNDKPLLYKKSCDTQGHFEMQTFKIIPYTEEVPNTNYVSQESFHSLEEKLNVLETRLNEFSNKGANNGNNKQREQQ